MNSGTAITLRLLHTPGIGDFSSVNTPEKGRGRKRGRGREEGREGGREGGIKERGRDHIYLEWTMAHHTDIPFPPFMYCS